MAKQLNLSFKENQTELELYEWVKSKLNPGVYIKELLYSDYLAEKNGVARTTFIPKNDTVENTVEDIDEEKVIVNENFNEDEVDAF